MLKRLLQHLILLLAFAASALPVGGNAAPIGLKRAVLLRPAVDRDASSWVKAVYANGGTVGAAQRALASQTFSCLKRGAAYALIDDAWQLAAENSTQALTSLKQRRLATAVNSPLFAPYVGFKFDGSSNYLRTGFIPTSHAQAMTLNNVEISAWEAINLAVGNYAIGVNAGSGAIAVIPRSGGGQYSGNTNSGSASVGSAATSVGLVSLYQGQGQTFGAYFNGASAGTTTVTPLAGLPNAEYYIGAINHSGTAQNFRASMLRFAATGASRTAAQETAVYTCLAAYYARLPIPDTYVSASGSDSAGIGIASAPYKTWDVGYAAAQANGRLLLDGTTGSPTLYQSASTTTIGDKSITVQAINPLGAKIAGGSGTSRGLLVNPTTAVSMTVKDVIIDPSQNTGGAASDAIDLATPSALYSIAFQGVQVQGWKTYAMTTCCGNLNANVHITGGSLSGGNVQAGIDIRTLNSGNFLVDGGFSGTITALNTAGYGLINIGAVAVGPTCKILDVAGSVTTTVTASSVILGLQCFNFAGAVINGDSQNTGTRKTMTLTGSGSVQGVPISVATNKAGDATELPDDDSALLNYVTQAYTAGGGAVAQLSGESGDRTKQNRLRMDNVDGYGNSASQTAGLHGPFVANCTNCSITNTHSHTVGIGWVDKLNLGATLTNVSAQDFTSTGGLAKGSTNSTWNNPSATSVSGDGSATLLHAEDDSPGTGTHTTGLSVNGGTWTVNGGSGAALVIVDANNTASFSGNNYQLTSGSLATNGWQYQGTNYPTFLGPSGWQFLREANATSNVP